MGPTEQANVTTRDQWVELVSRQFELDADRLERRMYHRRHRRHGLEYGQARIEYAADDPGVRRRPAEHLTVLQISPDGLMLRGFDPPPLGATVMLTVYVEDSVCVLRGAIRHVTQTLGGYKVGVELVFDGAESG